MWTPILLHLERFLKLYLCRYHYSHPWCEWAFTMKHIQSENISISFLHARHVCCVQVLISLHFCYSLYSSQNICTSLSRIAHLQHLSLYELNPLFPSMWLAFSSFLSFFSVVHFVSLYLFPMVHHVPLKRKLFCLMHQARVPMVCGVQ